MSKTYSRHITRKYNRAGTHVCFDCDKPFEIETKNRLCTMCRKLQRYIHEKKANLKRREAIEANKVFYPYKDNAYRAWKNLKYIRFRLCGPKAMMPPFIDFVDKIILKQS